jgi:hypothetical protein
MLVRDSYEQGYECLVQSVIKHATLGFLGKDNVVPVVSCSCSTEITIAIPGSLVRGKPNVRDS